MWIKGARYRMDAWKFNFPSRIVNIWINLPSKVVNAPSLNSFKNRIDSHWKKEAMNYNHECIYSYKHRPVATDNKGRRSAGEYI